MSDVLAAYSDEKLSGIKQFIQERQSGSLSLEEVERTLQQSGKADVASRLREKLKKGDTLLDTHRDDLQVWLTEFQAHFVHTSIHICSV